MLRNRAHACRIVNILIWLIHWTLFESLLCDRQGLQACQAVTPVACAIVKAILAAISLV